MGHTTDFIGHVAIHPPLNTVEQHYLTAFASSRRCERPGGPYDVPPNPAAERMDDAISHEAYNSLAAGQPSLWCGWVPCWDGCCIAHDGIEKFYGATAWMSYLIDHFLAPHAHARESGLAWFDGFTFDHTADGIIAGCRRDTRELFLIEVERNIVREETVVPSTAKFAGRRRLPYERQKDIDGPRRRARRRSSKAGEPRQVR